MATLLGSVTSDTKNLSPSHSVLKSVPSTLQKTVLADSSYKKLSHQERRDLAWTVLTDAALKDKLEHA